MEPVVRVGDSQSPEANQGGRSDDQHWIKRLGCGYRNRERFRNASCFHLGGLDLYPNTLATHTNP